MPKKYIGSREFKNQRTMKSPVRLYILERTVKVYHDTSIIWLLHWDPRKENTKKQDNMKEKNLTRPQVYSELQATKKNAEGGRISSPQDWAPLLVIQYQISRLEILCIQVTLKGLTTRCMCIYEAIKEKETLNLTGRKWNW